MSAVVEPYLAPALGALILLGLSVLISQMRELTKTMTDQGERIVKIATVVGIDGNGLVSKVQYLYDARAAEMETELRELREDRRHGPPDRRD